jgi:hypothetical protein
MKAAITLMFLALSTPAFAGGLGTLVSGGFHSETVYFYDKSDDNQQYQQPQLLGSVGGGLEVILGDQDDRFQGIFRGYWFMDGPQHDPATTTGLVSPQQVVAGWRDEPRHIGIATIGLQIGLIGEPSGFQVTAVGAVGSGFLTNDHTEFLVVELGGGFTHPLGRQVQLFGNVVGNMRVRKGTNFGATSYVGTRFLFD